MNQVEPSLVRVEGGALLVWAQRRGAAYRLRTARFGDRWTAPRTLDAMHASFPRFAELAEEGRFLIHRSRDGWTALELDANGRELQRAEIGGDRRERPVLSAAGGGVALRWQRGERLSAVRWERMP